MSNLQQLSWHNKNRFRLFPFSDTATMRDISGMYVLPNGIFTDARLYLQSDSAPYYIKSIDINPSTFTVTIAAGDAIVTGSHSIDIPADFITFYNDTGHEAGILVYDKNAVDMLFGLGTQELIFSSDGLPFTASVCAPFALKGICTVKAANETFYNDMWLLGGNGVVLQKGEGLNEVVVTATGDPYAKLKSCLDGGVTADPDDLPPLALQTFVKTVTFLYYPKGDKTETPVAVTVTPDEFGNIFISPYFNAKKAELACKATELATVVEDYDSTGDGSDDASRTLLNITVGEATDVDLAVLERMYNTGELIEILNDGAVCTPKLELPIFGVDITTKLVQLIKPTVALPGVEDFSLQRDVSIESDMSIPDNRSSLRITTIDGKLEISMAGAQ